MIQLTRFNNTHFFLNADLIQSVEGTPDTVITLTNREKIIVKETTHEVIVKIIHYRRLVENPQLDLRLGE